MFPTILKMNKTVVLVNSYKLETFLTILTSKNILDSDYNWTISNATVICLANEIYPLLVDKVAYKDNYKLKMYSLLYKRALDKNIELVCLAPDKTQNLNEFDLQNTPSYEYSYTNPMTWNEYKQFHQSTVHNIQPENLDYPFIKECAVTIGSWLFINKSYVKNLINKFATNELIVQKWILSLCTDDNIENIVENDSVFFTRVFNLFTKIRNNENLESINNRILIKDLGNWVICQAPSVDKKEINTGYLLEKYIYVINYDLFKILEDQETFSLFYVIGNDTFTSVIS